MTRVHSLEQDLRSLINNQKYSDIEILCEGEKKLYGWRAILAARSGVFDRLLYNGSYEKQISFPKINTSGMDIILELGMATVMTGYDHDRYRSVKSSDQPFDRPIWPTVWPSIWLTDLTNHLLTNYLTNWPFWFFNCAFKFGFVIYWSGKTFRGRGYYRKGYKYP